VQFDRSKKNPDVNLNKMLKLLESINSPVDIILLPEDWLGPAILSHQNYLSILKDLQYSLPSKDSLLISGAQYVHIENKTISTGAFICNKEIVFYDKHFPSYAIGERKFVMPGNKKPVINHRGVNMGSIICVDIFYPEIVRNMALRGAQIIFNPANIPAHRMDLWQHIGITRAAENTVFLVMANNSRTRYQDGREVMGRSFAAGPDGTFFQDFGCEPGVYYLEINLHMIDKVRERWKYLEDITRKNDLDQKK
jgi:predicted amidohydrolase